MWRRPRILPEGDASALAKTPAIRSSPPALATSHRGHRPPHRRGVDRVFHHVVADHEIAGRALGIAEDEEFAMRQLHAGGRRGHARVEIPAPADDLLAERSRVGLAEGRRHAERGCPAGISHGGVRIVRDDAPAARARLVDGFGGQERALDLYEVHVRGRLDAGIGHGGLDRGFDQAQLDHGAELFGQEAPGAGDAGDQALARRAGTGHVPLDEDGHVRREDSLGAARHDELRARFDLAPRDAEPRREERRVGSGRVATAEVVDAAIALRFAEHADDVGRPDRARVEERGQAAYVFGRRRGEPVDLNPLHGSSPLASGQRRSRTNGAPIAAGIRAVRPSPASTASDTT